MNRSDIGLSYSAYNYKREYPTYTYEQSFTDIELSRPGAEYRGLTYWLNDNLVVRAGIEGLMLSSTTTTTPTSGPASEEKISFSGLGGGVSIAQKLDIGLALGAGISYTSAGGKPDSLDGMYDIYGGNNTSKVEMSATNINWGVGGVYALDNLGKDLSLTIGLQAGSGNDLPNVTALSSLSISPLALGDYNIKIETAGSILGIGDVTDTKTYSQNPLIISGDAIFHMGDILEGAILFDTRISDYKLQTENTGYGVFAPAQVNYKTGTRNQMGITPVLQAKLPISEDINLLPGVQFSTWDSRNYDSFALDTATADPDDTYKVSSMKVTASGFAVGLGLQALEKQLQVAPQHSSGTYNDETTSYTTDGTAISTSKTEGDLSRIGVGIGFWVMPVLALRAGYAMLADVVKDGTIDSNGNRVDDIDNTSRITVGAGLALPNGLAADLLIKLDTYTDDPELDPKPTKTAMGIFLGLRTPL